MNKLNTALLLGTLILVGCSTKSPEHDITYNYKLPSQLGDCHIYAINGNAGGSLTVVKCPSSDTSTSDVDGKSVTVVDKKALLKKITVNGINYIETNL